MRELAAGVAGEGWRRRSGGLAAVAAVIAAAAAEQEAGLDDKQQIKSRAPMNISFLERCRQAGGSENEFDGWGQIQRCGSPLSDSYLWALLLLFFPSTFLSPYQMAYFHYLIGFN